MYAVGSGYPSGQHTISLPLIFHYDGSDWTEAGLSLPDGRVIGSLSQVWGSSIDNVYAIGYASDGLYVPSKGLPLLYHYDGIGWTESSPSLPDGWTEGYLIGIWGSSANDVYIVGRGVNAAGNSIPLVYHYDGNGWTEVNIPLPPAGYFSYLDSVWGTSANDLYAIGTAQNTSTMRSFPLAYHYDGTGWTEVSPSLPDGWTEGELSGLWISSDGKVYMAGFGFNGSFLQPVLYKRITTDQIAPTVSSILRADPDHRAASVVNFTVTFSESVTDVDKSDFTLVNATGNISDVTIGNVSGFGNTYTVSVNTGSGNGMLRLDVPAGATIYDLTRNVLGGLPFTSGETYTMNNGARYDGIVSRMGDFNGDEKAKIAVFRPSTSTWHIYGVGDFVYGTVGDIPGLLITTAMARPTLRCSVRRRAPGTSMAWVTSFMAWRAIFPSWRTTTGIRKPTLPYSVRPPALGISMGWVTSSMVPWVISPSSA